MRAPEHFDQLAADLRFEHQPATPTEKLLVDNMAQHYWLMQRALSLQGLSFKLEGPHCDSPEDLALYIRYQTTHASAPSTNAFVSSQTLEPRKEKRQLALNRKHASQPSKPAAKRCTLPA